MTWLIAAFDRDDFVWRLRLLVGRVLAAAIFALGMLTFFVVSINAPEELPLRTPPALLAMLIGMGLLLALSIKRVQTYLLAGMPFLFLVITLNITPDVTNLFTPIVITLVGGALLGTRFVYAAVQLILSLYLFVNGQTLILEGENWLRLVLYFVTVSAIGLTLRFITYALQSQIQTSQRSQDILELSATMGQQMSRILDLKALMNYTIEEIRSRLGFYHVQIFLVDAERKYAYLSASTGEVGQRLLARQHRLPIDTRSVIGRVIQVGTSIISRDTDRDERHAFNELLPTTRAELAIPIVDGDVVIGALDIQSEQVNSFNELEIQAVQVIANQLATAIRNARLFEEQERSLSENKRLFFESETNLREIQRLNRQLTRQAWQDYLGSHRYMFGVTLTPDEFRSGADWSKLMLDARQRRRAMIETKGANTVIAVPVELRGEAMGAIEIEIPHGKHDEDTVEMLQAIAQRLAISLDNARLFEETQETTAQEQRIGEMVSDYQRATTLDDLLKITLQGLTETLGAEGAQIRLGMEDTPHDNGASETTQGEINS